MGVTVPIRTAHGRGRRLAEHVPPPQDGRRARRGPSLRVDATLYATSAVVAAAGWASAVPVYRAWGRIALVPYVAAAAVAFVASFARARRPTADNTRVAELLAVGVFVLATVLPLAMEVAARPSSTGDLHVQSETLVVEQGAAALLHGVDPYAASFGGELSRWPRATRTHFPYLPALLVLGLPHASAPAPFTDARLVFLAGALVCGFAATRVARLSPAGRLRVLQAIAVLPTGAVLFSGGGEDVTVVAVLLLALALAERGRPAAAGIAAAVAAAMKQVALPVAVLAAVVAIADSGGAAKRAGRRAPLAAAATFAALVAPFVLWSPAAFVEDAVRFPLGFGKVATNHPTPMPGVLLARALPATRVALVVAVALAVVALLVRALRRRRPTAASAAVDAAAVVAVAMLLSPASRIGFVVYPLDLLVWSAVVRWSA